MYTLYPLQHLLRCHAPSAARQPLRSYWRVAARAGRAFCALLCRDLEKQPIEEFEVAQLGNLCPEHAEEAKILIPSLQMPRAVPVDSDKLTEVLQALDSCKQFAK